MGLSRPYTGSFCGSILAICAGSYDRPERASAEVLLFGALESWISRTGLLCGSAFHCSLVCERPGPCYGRAVFIGDDLAVQSSRMLICSPRARCYGGPRSTTAITPLSGIHQTNTNTAVTHAGANIFCSGHAFLPNGQLLVAGGHINNWVGLPNAYMYNPLNNTWTRLPDMNNGRWYPTSTTLPNGDVLVISGTINTRRVSMSSLKYGRVRTASWRNLTTAHLALPFYPFMFVAPNGQGVLCRAQPDDPIP